MITMLRCTRDEALALHVASSLVAELLPEPHRFTQAKLWPLLPYLPRLLHELRLFRDDPAVVGFHLRGVFALRDLAEPDDSFALGNYNPPALPAFATLCFMAYLEETPLALSTYGCGAVFHNVLYRSLGSLAHASQRALRPHTDLPHGWLPGEEAGRFCSPAPSTVYLTCLVNRLCVPTRIIAVRAVFSRLSAQDIALLSEPVFSARSPTASTDKIVMDDCPCFVIDNETVLARISPNLVWSPSPPHQAALEHLLEVADQLMRDVVMSPGDILVLKNHTALHGRCAVQPNVQSTSGPSRWLLRSYAIHDG